MVITLLRCKSKNSCKIYYAAEAFKGRAKSQSGAFIHVLAKESSSETLLCLNLQKAL